MAQAPQERTDAPAVPTAALRALVDAVRAALSSSEAEALQAFATAAAVACGADAVIVRLAEPSNGELTARAVHAVSPALVAELAGSRVDARGNGRAGQLEFAFAAAIEVDGRSAGELELLRESAPFTESETLVARIAADELGLVLQALVSAGAADLTSRRALVLAGEGLAARTDDERIAEDVARLAAEAAGARAALVWRADGDEPSLSGSFGESAVAGAAALSAARIALHSRSFLTHERIGGAAVVSLRLGEPAAGVLQLVLAEDPDSEALAGMRTFALRAASALRAGDRARAAAEELARARVLLDVLAETTAELSLQHALATAMRHATETLAADRGAVYLRDGRRLQTAAARNLAGPHAVVAERLLELALGPHRGRGLLTIVDVGREPGLASVADAAGEAGITCAVVLPLVVRGEAIGLLAVYPPDGAEVGGLDEALLGALGAQLAIALNNAGLHERAQALAERLDRSLESEKEAARRVRALYEVSQSFARSLSLEATLDALARSAVELLGVDAAAIRMPDVRRDVLVTRALHVRDARLEPAVRPVLTRPQPSDAVAIQRFLRRRRPVRLGPDLARELGGAHRLLAPFLEKGSTAALVPVATPTEVVAVLTIVSFDPGDPISRDTLDTALSIAAPAALAIDNGRLYQQQKQFADTMQRSLLPLSHPRLEGLQIGEVYESSARVEVGGDVYDFVELGEGKLAVVLGDVTGHGIEATADMAMAKFVFRSLAREHPDPGDFLASANEVVVDEIATGKFITMVYVTVDAANGELVAASAGHPPPLLAWPDGHVEQLGVGGLALGIEGGQVYEERRAQVVPGGVLVLYTDGVIEARREGELYGVDRLAAVVSEARSLAAADIARAVIADCRAFAGEPGDDCAVVVIKKTW
jgi:serine phosphatase RsbU (regulator of sigma subunit)